MDICLKRFGNIPPKEAGIIEGIDELKDYFKFNEDPLRDRQKDSGSTAS